MTDFPPSNQQPPEPKSQALIERPQPSMHRPPHGYDSYDPEDEDEIDLRAYWQIIVKKRLLVLGSFLVVFIGVVIATFIQTPIYRATVLLQIEREAAKVVEYQDVSPIEKSGEKDFYTTQYELIKSRSLAKKVIEQLRLADDQIQNREKKTNLIDWFTTFLSSSDLQSEDAPINLSEAEKNTNNAKIEGAFIKALTVEPVRNSRLVKVSFDSPDPLLATRIANAIGESYISMNLEKKYNASTYAKTFLEDRIAQVKVKLEEAERAQVEYAKANQIFNLDKDGGSTSGQNLQEFNSALSKAEQERIKAESMYIQLKESGSSELPQSLESGLLQQLKATKAKLETDYQEKLKTFKPGYPAMQELHAQIKEINEQIQKEISSVRKSIKTNYEAAKANEASLAGKLKESKREMLDLQSRSIQYNILKRETDTNRQLYEGLLQRLKEVSVSGGVGTNNIFIVDKAEVPKRQYSPDIKLNLLIGVLLGIVSGIGLAIFFVFMDDTFQSTNDVEKYLGLSVIGVVPDTEGLNATEDLLAHTIADARSGLSEALRSIRTALQFTTSEGVPKLLGVTSSEMGEGKSTISAGLAIHFAQLGLKVLIIDADLRRPTLHKTFSPPNAKGLSHLLAGGATLTDILHLSHVNNLSYIIAGATPPNPTELLNNYRFTELLRVVSEHYDIVIIDSPPILGLADALVIGSTVKNMVLVIEAGETARKAAVGCVKRLLTANIRPLGCILNRFHPRHIGYGYDYHYAYYYGSDDAGKKKRKSKRNKEEK